jgi:hypothetical protein
VASGKQQRRRPGPIVHWRPGGGEQAASGGPTRHAGPQWTESSGGPWERTAAKGGTLADGAGPEEAPAVVARAGRRRCAGKEAAT